MPIFRVKSVKIYTGQKKFTLAPLVAPRDKYQVCQQTVRPFSPFIISSYYLFRPCVSYLKDQTQADSATIFTRLTNRGRPPSAIMTHCALSRQCYTHCSRWFVFLYSLFFLQVRIASFCLLFD